MKKKRKIRVGNIVTYVILVLFAFAALFPVFFVATHSFMEADEVVESYGSVFAQSESTAVDFHIFPRTFSLRGYFEVFLATPSYLMKFWNSMFLSCAITAGQVLLACLGGYGFAKFRFPMKNIIFYIMVILMMMPLQVTLVPNYMVLDKFSLIGSYTGLILTGIFSTFGVILLTQIFSSIPNNILEAAKLDGANQVQILFRIVIPCSKSGVASLVILNFIDTWNMVEQPLVFLKDPLKYPLSIFMANINNAELGISFVCAILAMLPVVLLFLHFKDALITGIESSGLR